MSTDKNNLVAAEAAIKEREDALKTAVDEGKIMPDGVAQYRERYERDPRGTKALLSRLAPGLRPDAVPRLTTEEADRAFAEYCGER